jgi:hypothetical protein
VVEPPLTFVRPRESTPPDNVRPADFPTIFKPLRPPHSVRLTMLRIKQLPMVEQGKQNPQASVDDASKRPGVTVATTAQRLIVAAGGRIFLGCCSSPVIRRLAQIAIAGVAHRHDPASPPTALLRDGRNAHPAPQCRHSHARRAAASRPQQERDDPGPVCSLAAPATGRCGESASGTALAMKSYMAAGVRLS